MDNTMRKQIVSWQNVPLHFKENLQAAMLAYRAVKIEL